MRTLVDIGIHLSVAFIKSGTANLGVRVRLYIRKKLGRTKNSEQVCGSRQNIWFHPSRRWNHFDKIHCEGRPSERCVSYSNEINFTEHCEAHCQEVPIGSRPRTMFETARKVRSNLGDYATLWTKWSKPEHSVAWATRKLCRVYWSKHGIGSQKKHGTCTITYIKSKVLFFKHVKNSWDFPTRQRNRKLSHLGQIANMTLEILLWTAAHLSTWWVRMISHLGKKIPSENQKEPAVITTASGEAESMEEAASVRWRFGPLRQNDAVGRFTNSSISGFVLRRSRLLVWMEGTESLHRCEKMEQVIRCKSENYVPTVQVSKELLLGKHREACRITFPRGLNLWKKASLVNPQTHLMSRWNNLWLNQKRENTWCCWYGQAWVQEKFGRDWDQAMRMEKVLCLTLPLALQCIHFCWIKRPLYMTPSPHPTVTLRFRGKLSDMQWTCFRIALLWEGGRRCKDKWAPSLAWHTRWCSNTWFQFSN